jgi:hypothetical protein
LFTPIVTVDSGFALFEQLAFQSSEIGFFLFDQTLQPTSGFIPQPFRAPAKYGDIDSIGGTGAIASTSQGFAEVGLALDQPDVPCDNGSCFGVFLYFLDRHGNKLRDRVQVNEGSSFLESASAESLSIDGEGNLAVAFYRLYGAVPSDGSKVFVRRFSQAGDPTGPEIPVETDLPGNQLSPVIAASPDGEFMVAWLYMPDPQADFGEIYARRFGSDGEPLGPAFRVSSDLLAQSSPLIASDAFGNYFVTWSSFQEVAFDVRGRLYRHNGKPVSGDFRINQDTAFDQSGGVSAFAPNGTLTVSYTTDDPAVTGDEENLPVVRRYAASPGPEICAIAGAKIFCDLGRTGGFPELQLTWGGSPGEVTLFGDVDGDGREDVCSYFKGQFRCNTDHEGVKIGWRETLGLPGDIPLLADVDGDGKADPCVRRKDLLLCDTARDGHLHYQLRFGHGGEVPLLGDLDGDGKADLCLVEGAAWNCRLSSTGERLHFSFGRAGDSPALGDADRDGKADPCVLRHGLLQCNTKHDGGPADYTLQLDVPAGARLLFGNLDGL